MVLPANTIDCLQPLDLSINKAAKDFLQDTFRQRYAKEVSKYLQEPESEVMPVEMSAAVMKEFGAKWLVAFYNYISTHPELVKNGFKEARIIEALGNGMGPP